MKDKTKNLSDVIYIADFDLKPFHIGRLQKQSPFFTHKKSLCFEG